MKMAVKYCGGCQCGYDRAKLVRKIEHITGVKLSPPKEKEKYDIVFVINGCMSRCANTENISTERFIMIDHDLTEEKLKKIIYY